MAKMQSLMMEYPMQIGIFLTGEELVAQRQNIHDHRKVCSRFTGIYGHSARGFGDMERAVSLSMGSICLGLSAWLGVQDRCIGYDLAWGMVFLKR